MYLALVMGGLLIEAFYVTAREIQGTFRTALPKECAGSRAEENKDKNINTLRV